LFEGFEKIEFAADNAPATGLGRAAAERQQKAAGFVDQRRIPTPTLGLSAQSKEMLLSS
jgi:hypothetical protein